jgi:2-methylcitrate dehydratase PrpD
MVRVADFVRGLRWESLAPETKGRAILCLLDGLGAALAGTLAPVSHIASDLVSELWAGDGATILLSGKQASAPGAAFANACAGNALDVDDDAIFTRGHPGAQLIPAALAVAEQIDASGQQLLQALVVGYEMAIRVGRCWHGRYDDYYRGDGAWGAVACAAASAHLLGLDAVQVEHALGIAEYHAPNAPMMRDIADPTMVKHAIGWGAMTGVTAALLAGRGFTGIPSLLAADEYRDWLADLGERYWMDDWVFYKEWCSCAWGHPAGVAALDLVRQHAIPLEEIEHIRVRAFDEAVKLYQGYPTTTEEAQFSVMWPLACLLLDGELGPAQILEDRFDDPRVRALVDKIEMVLDPEVDRLYREAKEMDLRMHSAVEISLRDGRVLDSGIVERAADRWDGESLVKKFHWLVGHVVEADRVEAILQLVLDCENLPSTRRLTRLLI